MFVATRMEKENMAYLQHEEKVYSRIYTIQEQSVPVCMGLVDLHAPAIMLAG